MLPLDLEEWRNSFQAFVLEDIRKAQCANVQVGLISLTVVAIETLSGFCTGKETCSCTFERFVKNYFPPSYHCYARNLYACIRNGLLHKSIVKQVSGQTVFQLTGKKGEKHLEIATDGSGIVYLNRESFADDFLQAAKDYFSDLEKDTCLQENARRRIGKDSYLVVLDGPPSTPSPLSAPFRPTGMH